ncbi:MAG: malonyl-CoA decarboxylase family protein [Xanthobacteraceae bacterium]|nr:malonyl-CoA decarboxylase family protein [Xanthobacteraceae bacterium]
MAANKSFLSDLFQTISERGRDLMARARGRTKPVGEVRTENLVELCEHLLSGRGEASGVALAAEILEDYRELKTGERVAFFEALAHRFGPDRERLKQAAQHYIDKQSEDAEAELHDAAEPRRQEIVRRLNLAPDGTETLVSMRANLLDALERRSDLESVDRDFVHLFSSWFNRGFLVLKRIDWSSPAIVLEKIIRYEAVHEIRDWNDLRARIDPPDRRCYAFFHPALTDEPLIFVEVALTKEIPGAIGPILTHGRKQLDPREATTAVFYSISNTQRGLAGVSFGSFLIKQVAEEISREFPKLDAFVTLSPVPGFAKWLARERKNESSDTIRDADRAALALLDRPGWEQSEKSRSEAAGALTALAAHYFLHGKTSYGRPLDPVARFHLGNGAALAHIHASADLSPRGIAQSHGVMVNYRYDLSQIEQNHEAYAEDSEVVASKDVRKLLRQPQSARAAPARIPVMSGGNYLFGALEGAIPSRDKTLIELPDGKIITYREVFDLAAKISAYLVRCKVMPGDRVAVQVEKSWQNLALYLGVVRAGGVYLPLNTAYPLAELEYFLSDAEPRVVVCKPETESGVNALAAKLKIATVETLGVNGDGTLIANAKDATPLAPAARAAKDLAAILYTSGTTGRSKGAMLSHENLLSNAMTLKDYWRFTEKDVVLHALPIYHTHGLFVAMNVVLLAGASMLFFGKFEADEMIRLMPKATSMMGVPTFYVRFADHPKVTKETTKHMRLFVSGSAPLLAETHRAFSEKTGHAILERYGMTETNMNTSNPYDGDRIPGTVGFPLPGVELRIADPESGKVLAQGEIGVIEVKGPNVFQGYWRMPEKTAAEFRADGFFITGDLGKIDERGYVHIVGRGKDLVISGGFNVYPKEVEGEIDAIPGVVESAVIGVAHPDLGEAVTAVVVKAKGSALSEAEILGALEGRIARFKQPKHVFFVDDLPRNAMGKVQKNVLRETYAKTYSKNLA